MLAITTNVANPAQIYLNTICLRNFDIPPKIEVLVFFKNKSSMCRRGTSACAHPLDFQYKTFSYTFFVVKSWPLYVNFSIPPCENWCFSQGSTPLVGMKFCEHVPNSLTNKNLKGFIQNLLGKVNFLAFKTLQSPWDTWKKNIFFNFECYDLANDKERVSKIWCAWDFEAILTKKTPFVFYGLMNFSTKSKYIDHLCKFIIHEFEIYW